MPVQPGCLAELSDIVVWHSVPWLQRAACRGKPRYWWFVTGRTKSEANLTKKAKKICADCPVRWHCLSKYLDQNAGIFGGLDEDERARLKPQIPYRQRHNIALLKAMVTEEMEVESAGSTVTIRSA